MKLTEDILKEHFHLLNAKIEKLEARINKVENGLKEVKDR